MYTDFKHNELSQTEYDQLNKEYNDMYNGQLFKQKIFIDKNNLNCM